MITKTVNKNFVGILKNHRGFLTGPEERRKGFSKLHLNDIKIDDIDVEINYKDALEGV